MTDLSKREYVALEILKAMLSNVEAYRGDVVTSAERSLELADIILRQGED